MIESTLLRDAHQAGAFNDAFALTVEEKEVIPEGSILFTPTEALTAIAAIMREIRLRHPDMPFSQPLDSGDYSTTEERILAQLSRNIINRSSRAGDLTLSQSREHKNPGACPDAEAYFADILRAKNTGATDVKVGSLLVFEQEGHALLIQKFFGAVTALGLQPVNIDGIEFPSGTIFSLYSDIGSSLQTVDRKNQVPKKDLSIMRRPATEISSIAPLRLSLWALPATERPVHPDIENPRDLVEQDEAEIISNGELSDFRAAFSREVAVG